MERRRFKGFTDEEVYMLSRHAIETEKCLTNHTYSDTNVKTHSKLFDELLKERMIRSCIKCPETKIVHKQGASYV